MPQSGAKIADTYCDISHFSDLMSLLLALARLIFIEYY
ncbi:hypothetical protein HMPREF9176_2280 [Streptococcus downei F0415]|nr:hypothetical protein HMPREF9176_2280 [Streptococcus downei F0415]